MDTFILDSKLANYNNMSTSNYIIGVFIQHQYYLKECLQISNECNCVLVLPKFALLAWVQTRGEFVPIFGN